MSKTFSQIKSYARLKSIPIIPVRAKDVSFLSAPDDFYQLILDKVRSAQNRIILSALYLGTGFKEVALVQEISDSFNKNSHLDVKIILDANRAQRADRNYRTSVTMLENLKTNDMFHIHLVNTCKVSGLTRILLNRFKKFNELFSTYHSKALIFDDDVILTGANLSHIYFDNRQDRYMLIKNSKLLSGYVSSFLGEIAQSGQNFSGLVRSHNSNYNNANKNIEREDHDCYVIPLFQHRSSGLTDCDDFLKFLNNLLPDASKVYLSSGYFNPFLDLKLDSVLVPSEEANGFYQGSGLLKYVPQLYSAILRRFAGAHSDCDYRLYNRLDWSFHAKGVWVENLNDIYVHLIGSSNYNWRSSTRDFETQFAIITNNPELIQKIRAERESLWQQSTQLENNSTSIIYDTFSRVFRSLL